MDSQQTHRPNDHRDGDTRQQQFIQGRDASTFDYGQYYVLDNPSYGTAQSAPAHAYTINRAYNGKSVSGKSLARDSHYGNGLSKRIQLKEYHKKRLRHFQLYVIIVIALAILICLAFGLGFGLGLKDDNSDTGPSSRLQNQDPNKEPDVIIGVIVEDLYWDPAMTDTQSSSFLRSADITERSMDRYFGKSSMAELYDYAVVTGFWQGSVGTDAGIYLKAPSSDSSQEIKDTYTSIRNTSGEHIIADSLYMGQDASSTQPLADRIRFRRDSLQIKKMTTPVSSVTGTSTMSTGIGLSNTTLRVTIGTSEGTTSETTVGTTSETTVGTTSETTVGTTSETTVGTTSGISSEITLGTTLGITVGTTVETTSGTTVGTTSGISSEITLGTTVGTTLGITVGTTVETTSGTTSGSTLETTLGTTLGTTVGTTLETTLGTTLGTTVGTTLETTLGTTLGTTVGTTLETTTMSGATSSSGMADNSTVSETQGSTTANATQWTTPTPTTNQSDPNNSTHVNETLELAVWANFTLLSVEWNSILTDKTSNQYRDLAAKVAEVVGNINMNITVLEADFFLRDTKSLTVSTILSIFADKINITTLTQNLNASLQSQQQSTNMSKLELTGVEWLKDLSAVLRQGELRLWYNGKWIPVCENNFTASAGDVVCRQLGYDHGFAFSGSIRERALQFSNLTCSSNTTQNSLSECNFQLKDWNYCIATNLSCHNTLMRYELVGGDGLTHGYVKLTMDNKDGLLCSTEEHTDAMATYLCREINSTFYGGLNLQADNLQIPARGNVWQVEAKCYRPDTDSTFSDCVHSDWKFLNNVTIHSDFTIQPDDQQPYMPDSTECPLNLWFSTTEIPNTIPESATSEICLMKVYCHTQPVDIYQEPNSNAGYIIATNSSDPQVFCRDNFTNLDAAAACKTIGYPKGGTSLTFNPIPWFNSRVWKYSSFDYTCLEDVTIYNCSKTQIDVTHRACSGPAVVKCVADAATEKELDMKLDKDGNTVLLYYKGQWGTICVDATKHPWTTKEAIAVCKQLNYTHGVPVSTEVIPAVPLPHVITNVTCSDNQTKLADCTYTEVKDDSCNSSHAATVFCYNATNVATLDFVSGSEFNSGLVKVTREGKEGYLCTSSLPSKAATVICHGFGFVSGVQDTYNNSTDPHLQYIWQTDFNGQCTANDVLGETCRSAAWSLHLSNLSLADRKCVCNDNYVSLYCYGKVKLSNEPRTNYGPLLIYEKSDYNLICHEDINQQTATAACREIMRSNTSDAVILYPGTFVQTDTARNAKFNCTQDATYVSDCVTFSSGLNLKCKETSVLCYEGKERPGPIPENATEWRIEETVVQLKAYGIWGTICSDGWTNTEATVLCKTINSEYTIGITKVNNRLRTVPMWIASVTCGANTTNINMCSRMTFLDALDYCALGGNAQTFCFRGENDVPRFTLADTEETSYYVKGHLAVTRNNQTGYLCSPVEDEIENNVDALCHIMGYSGGQLSQVNILRKYVNSFWSGNVDCNWYTRDCFLIGQFSPRTDSNQTGMNVCGSLHESDILCFNSKVRLQDPELPEGFLLIDGQNGWQALCSQNFTLELANRFCTDAGYLTGNYTARSASEASLTAHFGDVICTEDAKFKDCTFNEMPNEVSDRCNEIVYISCTQSTNITTKTQ